MKKMETKAFVSRERKFERPLRCESCGYPMMGNHFCVGGLSRKEQLNVRLENTKILLKREER